MNISIKTLNKLEMSRALISWFESKYNDRDIDALLLINDLIADSNQRCAALLIVKILSIKNKIKYAMCAAKFMPKIFEIEYNNGSKQELVIDNVSNAISYAIQSDAANKNKKMHEFVINTCTSMSIVCAYSAANGCSDSLVNAEIKEKLIKLGVCFLKKDLKQQQGENHER